MKFACILLAAVPCVASFAAVRPVQENEVCHMGEEALPAEYPFEYLCSGPCPAQACVAEIDYDLGTNSSETWRCSCDGDFWATSCCEVRLYAYYDEGTGQIQQRYRSGGDCGVNGCGGIQPCLLYESGGVYYASCTY